MDIRYRLTLMNFLQFAVWGAYLTSMGKFLRNIGFGEQIGLFYAIQGFASIFMPGIIGIIADKWISAQKLLGICHLIAGIFIGFTGFYTMQNTEINLHILVTLYSLSVLFYMPTIALSNSVAYTLLAKNQMDTIKNFPKIRTIGTIGFIFSMLFVNFAGIKEGMIRFSFWESSPLETFQNNHFQFFVSGILGLILFLYCLTLPKCPTNKTPEKKSLYHQLGLNAFELFREKRMAIFFIFSALLGACSQITNGYANPFISSFSEIEKYANSWGVNNANALISLSQISETLCILLIPFFLKKFGIKKVMLIAMFSWFMRFGLLAVGNPAEGVWIFILSMIFYGIAFDFFNVSGSLFVEQKTPENIRSSAQGVFMMMTNGLGATLGMLIAGAVINHFEVFSMDLTPLKRLEGWRYSWGIFAFYALILGLIFMFIFKTKEKKIT